MNWSPVIEVIKTVKNYTLPAIASGLTYISTQCNTDITVLGGVVTVGMLVAFLQNTIVKTTPEEIKDKIKSSLGVNQ